MNDDEKNCTYCGKSLRKKNPDGSYSSETVAGKFSSSGEKSYYCSFECKNKHEKQTGNKTKGGAVSPTPPKKPEPIVTQNKKTNLEEKCGRCGNSLWKEHGKGYRGKLIFGNHKTGKKYCSVACRDATEKPELAKNDPMDKSKDLSPNEPMDESSSLTNSEKCDNCGKNLKEIGFRIGWKVGGEEHHFCSSECLDEFSSEKPKINTSSQKEINSPQPAGISGGIIALIILSLVIVGGIIFYYVGKRKGK